MFRSKTLAGSAEDINYTNAEILFNYTLINDKLLWQFKWKYNNIVREMIFEYVVCEMLKNVILFST